jgi:hypothetical protein
VTALTSRQAPTTHTSQPQRGTRVGRSGSFVASSRLSESGGRGISAVHPSGSPALYRDKGGLGLTACVARSHQGLVTPR